MKNRIKHWLQYSPLIYLELLRWKRRGHWSRDWIVDRNTDVVIEGFPRSANSYFLSAFQLIQERPLRIATHVHAPAQIVRACSLGKPTFVMIRNPADACRSLKALECQCNPDRIEHFLKISLEKYLRDYCSFYSRILECRDHFVLVDFNEVTRSIVPAIERMNRTFGTHFLARELTDSEKKQLFKEGGTHLSPDSDRERIKSMIENELSEPRIQQRLLTASAIHQQFLASH